MSLRKIKTHNPKNTFKLGQKVWAMHKNVPTEFYVEEIHHKVFAMFVDNPTVTTWYYLSNNDSSYEKKLHCTSKSIFKSKADLLQDFMDKHINGGT